MIILKKHDEIHRLVIQDEDGGEWEMDSQEFQWIEFFGDTVEIGTSHCILHADIIDTFLDTLIIRIP